MSRYSPISPSELSPEQHAAYEEASEICSKMFGDKFLYKNDDGAFIGPFAPLLCTPTIVDSFFKLIVELGKLSSLPPALREIAILVTGNIFNSKYELYAHGRVAKKSTGLTAAQIDTVKNGKKPTGEHALDEQDDVAFNVALELAGKGGPMSE